VLVAVLVTTVRRVLQLLLAGLRVFHPAVGAALVGAILGAIGIGQRLPVAGGRRAIGTTGDARAVATLRRCRYGYGQGQ
jgi:hypothetical protein